MKLKGLILTIWILTALSLRAEDNYPNKQIIGKDTVICSTVGQQKKYLEWKVSYDECEEIAAKNVKTFMLMDSVIKSQNKLITTYDAQRTYNAELSKRNDELLKVKDEKYNALETAYKSQLKKEKKRKIVTGLTTGSGLVIIGGLLIWKVLK